MIWLALYLITAIANAWRLRRLWAWAQRVNDCNWRLLTLIDEVAAFLIFVPLYAFALYPRMPMVGDTISSLSWAGELADVRWCRWLQIAIDALFRVLTSQRDHCEKAHAKWANPLGAMA
jgi:hypothetical protein